MAAAPAVSNPATRLESEWDEAQIDSALARLQEMHAQVGRTEKDGHRSGLLTE